MKQSYWQAEAGPSDAPQRRRPPRNADCVIVGGGLAGLTTAIRVKEQDPSLDVTLLEARFVGYGASGRNGGLLSPLAAPLLIAGAEASDEQSWALAHLWHEIQKAADWIAGTLPEAESKRVVLRLEAKGRITDSGIGRVARVLDRVQIPHRFVPQNGMNSARTLELAANTVHPFRLVRALAEYAERLGVAICEDTSVTAIEEGDRGATLHLATGTPITARTVVLSTNAYTSSISLPSKVPGQAVFNYMVEAVPAAPDDLGTMSPDGTFNVELNSSYAFYRAHGGRLIYGGIDKFGHHQADDMDVPDKIRTRLEKLLAESFPPPLCPRIARAWGGKFHVTSTDMPVIRRAAGSRAIVLNVGYGGTGVAMTLACARLAAGVVCGKQLTSEDARLLCVLQSGRFPVWGGVKFAAGVAVGLVAGWPASGSGADTF